MSKRMDPRTERYLLLFKLDAKNLLHRIKDRRHEYIEIFAMKRMRHHFAEVFWSRYDRATIHDLSYCGPDTIATMDQFYKSVDDLRWYLNHTEDMPKTIADAVEAKSNVLQGLYDTLSLYIDAELGVAEDIRQEEEKLDEEEQPAPWDTHEAQLFAEVDAPRPEVEGLPEEVFQGAPPEPTDGPDPSENE